MENPKSETRLNVEWENNQIKAPAHAVVFCSLGPSRFGFVSDLVLRISNLMDRRQRTRLRPGIAGLRTRQADAKKPVIYGSG